MEADPLFSPGEIIADAVYTLEEFAKRMRLGAAALRTARRQGLNVHRVGRRSYIIGRDFIAYLDRKAERTVSPVAPE